MQTFFRQHFSVSYKTEKNITQNSVLTTHTRTAPSKSMDRLSLSSMSDLVSDSGRADPRTMITWPGAEVAQWLCLLLTDCTFVLKNRDSLVFELGDCFIAQGSPCWAVLWITAQSDVQGGPKKTAHYTLVHIFAKYWPIFIILSPTHSVGNLQ